MTQTVDILRVVRGLPLDERIAVPMGTSVADVARTLFPHVGDRLVPELRMPDGRWQMVPPGLMAHVRIKQSGAVRFHARLQGGNSGQILGLVATIALSVIAPGLGSIAATSLAGFGAAVAGTAGFFALQSGISAAILFGGSYLAGKLFAPEPQRAQEAAQPDGTTYEAVATDRNAFGPEQFLPRVFGARRLALPDIVMPHAYFESGVEVVERLQAAHGPAAIDDIKFGSVPADGNDSVTTEVVEGQAGDATTTLVTRWTAPVSVSEELAGFRTNEEALEDQTTPANSSPAWVDFRTSGPAAMSEISIGLQVRSLIKNSDASAQTRIPVRMRFRPEGGSTWWSLPEIHVKGADAGTVNISVRLRWDGDFGAGDPAGVITYDLWREVPEVTAHTLADGSSGAQWLAHSTFSGGSGLQDVANVNTRRAGLEFRLNPAAFAKGAYEWQVMRGGASDVADLDNAYEIDGDVVSLFAAREIDGEWQTPVSQNPFVGQISVVSAAVICEESPCQMPGTALLAIKVRRQNAQGITARVRGYANDWNGTDAWDDWTGESVNPATHARQLLDDFLRHARVGEYSRFARIAALAQPVLVNADFTGWRAQCIKSGARVSLVAGGEPVSEVLQRLMAAGYARLVLGPGTIGVDWFRDRSADLPVMVFSPRNARIAAIKENTLRPQGIRATFANRDKDWREDEIKVPHPVSGAVGNWRAVEYRAVDGADDVRQRAEFDMLREYHRQVVWQVETDLEGMVLRPGDLVGLVTDLENDFGHGARIRQVHDARTLVLDQEIPVETTVATMADSFTFDALTSVGDNAYLVINHASGSQVLTIDAVAGRTIRVTADITNTDIVGAHVAIGSNRSKVRRMVVVEIAAGNEFGTTLTLADEAPQIYQHFKEKWGWTS